MPCLKGPGTEKPPENKMTRSVALLGSVLLFSVGAHAQQVSSKAPPLSPQETVNSMEIQSGYRMVPVLAEPHIHEPSAIAWDGNGRMYVVEMRTYMQDIDGQNQFAPQSRVSRHEDTDGDGVYDKHTVFADKLILPQKVPPSWRSRRASKAVRRVARPCSSIPRNRAPNAMNRIPESAWGPISRPSGKASVMCSWWIRYCGHRSASAKALNPWS